MRLLFEFPHVATRDCDVCAKFVHNEQTGEIRLHAGKPFPRTGPPPCAHCPKKRPDGPVELTPANWKAYQHYLECRAVGSFPDDPVVRQNAAIISRVTEDAQRAKSMQLMASLMNGGGSVERNHP